MKAIEALIYQRGTSYYVKIERQQQFRKSFKTLEEAREARDAFIRDNPVIERERTDPAILKARQDAAKAKKAAYNAVKVECKQCKGMSRRNHLKAGLCEKCQINPS